MSLREMPQSFICDVCQESQHVDLLCTATSHAVSLACVRCCGCHQPDDVEGTVILAWPARETP